MSVASKKRKHAHTRVCVSTAGTSTTPDMRYVTCVLGLLHAAVGEIAAQTPYGTPCPSPPPGTNQLVLQGSCAPPATCLDPDYPDCPDYTCACGIPADPANPEGVLLCADGYVCKVRPRLCRSRRPATSCA